MSLPSDPIALALCREYSERTSRNPRYSLRAFARSLDISHSLLSLVMNGRRAPSKPLRRKLAQTLEVREAEIPADEFARIADWVHFAILGLVALPGFRFGEAAVAKKLGIPTKRAAIAIAELKASGHLKKTRTGWRQATPPIRVDSSRPHPASSQFTRALLHKADEAMDQVPFSERNLTSIIFAMSAADVPYATEKIREFRRALCAELETRGKSDAVYALTVQLFPLTRGGIS